jgi:uncharacterized membrane protein YphA (DoxX/SURF4 family)
MEQRSIWQRRVYPLLVWIATLLVAFSIGAAGADKFVQADRWRQLFVGWGYPAWLSPVIGVIELVGVIGLLLPLLAAYGAMLLAAVMLVALLTLLGHPAGPLGWGATPAILLGLLGFVGASRWRRRSDLRRLIGDSPTGKNSG